MTKVELKKMIALMLFVVVFIMGSWITDSRVFAEETTDNSYLENNDEVYGDNAGEFEDYTENENIYGEINSTKIRQTLTSNKYYCPWGQDAFYYIFEFRSDGLFKMDTAVMTGNGSLQYQGETKYGNYTIGESTNTVYLEVYSNEFYSGKWENVFYPVTDGGFISEVYHSVYDPTLPEGPDNVEAYNAYALIPYNKGVPDYIYALNKKDEYAKRWWDGTNLKFIKGKCQMPYWGEGGGYLIGFETYDNPNNEYYYEMFVMDLTLYAQGLPCWVHRTGMARVPECALWTIWQPQYGYYLTLFRLYDKNGNIIDEDCYGFANAY